MADIINFFKWFKKNESAIKNKENENYSSNTLKFYNELNSHF